ncbi:MAG: wax ester/triacylglycerol synthase family O-acyltransferase [Actinobacteria bacterium]|nr:wax ester/triacylglycerol synthase family O-acyltransferase [Actinomycetota bacterium]
MQRMTGLDAGFLHMETRTLHMHTLKIAIVDPSTVPGGYTFAKVKDVLAARLHLLPPFRRRAVKVPLNLHHPVWIEDPDFDLGRHLRRIGCPAPGGMEELAEVISDIASRPLDRDRPLWEIWVVENLEDDNIAFVAKIHHALADGVAAAAMLMNVLETDPGALDAPPPAAPWSPEPLPSRRRLLADAALDALRSFLNVFGLLARTVAGLRRMRRRRREFDAAPPLPFAGPKTRFNAGLTPNRKYVTTSLSLADVKAVKEGFDVSVNDVVLAVCGGGLRRYLERHGELPERSLMAGVPVALTAAAQEARLEGNRVSNLFTTLRTDLADPVERLRSIHDVTAEAKELHQALGAETLAEWSDVTPPGPFSLFMRLYSSTNLASRHRPPINCIVSNVPGPSEPLFVAGARLLAIYSMGPILEGIGLNVTVWSYLDAMNFGLVACPEHVPDLWDLCGDLRDELAELLKVTNRGSDGGR